MTHTHHEMRTPHKRVTGLGSGHSGVFFWLWQRVSALMFLPFGIWLIMAGMAGHFATRAHFVTWMSSPLHRSVVCAALIGMGVHLAMGLQVVVEDYVPCSALKWGLIIAIRLMVSWAVGIGLIAALSL